MDFAGWQLPGVLSAGATFTSVYAAFARLDRIQSRANRQFVSRWLLGLKTNGTDWRVFFVEVFGRFFGRKHLSWRCVIASFGLSVLLVSVVVLISFLRTVDPVTQVENLVDFGVIAATACIADYASLGKTRLLLTSRLLQGKGAAFLLLVVAADFVATTLCYLFVLSALVVLALLMSGRRGWNELPDIFLLWFKTLAGDVRQNWRSGASFFELSYAAALLTSAWLWAYMVAAALWRAVASLPNVLRNLGKVVDMHEHPIRSLGFVASVISAGVVGLFSVL